MADELKMPQEPASAGSSTPRSAVSSDPERDLEMAPAGERRVDNNEMQEIGKDHDYGGSGIQAQQSQTESIWISQHMSLLQEILFVSICCCAQFTTQAGFAMPLYLLHVIGGSFGVSNPAQLSWAVAGYSLTVGTFILFSGRLGDAFGYKKMLLIGFLWYAIWSMIAGVSVYSNYVLFVFARVLQGVGPALCLVNALAIVGAAYPPGHRKAMVFSLFGASAPSGALAGAAVGSALAIEWWPWAFWSLAITLVLLAVVGYFVIPDPSHRLTFTLSASTLWEELDILGTLVGVAGMVLFNFAWNQAPLVGWAQAQIIVTLILGLALIIAFFVIEIRYAKNPLLPFDVVNTDVAFVLGVIVLGWATFGLWSLYFVQFSEVIHGNSPVLTAAWMSPVVVAGAIASLITGFLLGPLKFTPPIVMTIALCMFLVGVTLVATAPPTQTYWAQFFVATLVTPFGMDMSFPAATLIVSNAVKKQHQGIGASLIVTVVNYGISLGVGFAGTVEVHINNGGKTQADTLKGFRGALYFGIGLSGLGVLICLLFVARERYRRVRNKA